jgi:DNA-binding XRE family transcriptional regulator
VTILTKREVWDKPKPIGPARYTPDLNAEERANIRTALRLLRRRFGSWCATATALGSREKTVCKAGGTRSKPSVGLALRVARTVGVPVEDVLSGAWPPAGCCPTCGRSDELPGARM